MRIADMMISFPGLVLAIAIWGGMYWVSKQFCKKHDIN